MGPHHVSLLTWERVCGLCEVRGASTSRSNLVLSGCPLCDPETTDQRLTNDNPVLLLMWRPPDSPFVHVEYLHQFTLKTVLTLNIFCFFNTILGGRNMLSRLPNDAMSEFQSPRRRVHCPMPAEKQRDWAPTTQAKFVTGLYGSGKHVSLRKVAKEEGVSHRLSRYINFSSIFADCEIYTLWQG